MGIALSSIDPFIIQSIAEQACDVELIPARAACRRLRRAVCVPKRRNVCSMLKYGAQHNSAVAWHLAFAVHDRQKKSSHWNRIIRNVICKYGFPTGFEECNAKIRSLFNDVDQEIECAKAFHLAAGGHEDQCLKQVVGSNRNIWMRLVEGAALGGHVQLLERLLHSGTHHVSMDYNIIHRGVQGNHPNVCRLAMGLNFTKEEDYSCMALYAVEYRRYNILKLAIQWGARNYDSMLYEGMALQNVEACVLALDAGAHITAHYSCPHPFFYDLLDYYHRKCGASEDPIALCKFEKTSEFDAMYDRISKLDPERKRLLGSSVMTSMCLKTIDCSHSDPIWDYTVLCHRAKELGLTDFSIMSTEGALEELSHLALEWGAKPPSDEDEEYDDSEEGDDDSDWGMLSDVE